MAAILVGGGFYRKRAKTLSVVFPERNGPESLWTI